MRTSSSSALWISFDILVHQVSCSAEARGLGPRADRAVHRWLPRWSFGECSDQRMRSRRACEWVVLAKHLSVEGESEVRGQIPSLLIQGCPGFSAFRFQFLALIRHLLATLSREQPGGLLSALSLGCVLRLGPNSALTFFCFKPRHVSFSFVCVCLLNCVSLFLF